MIKFEMILKDQELQKKLNGLDDKAEDSISAVFDYNAAYATDWMKQNAPWTDRTGAARSGLIAIANNHGSDHELFLAYSVYYGIWLEIANSGRYQVLQPAMRVVGDKILKDLKRMMYRA